MGIHFGVDLGSFPQIMVHGGTLQAADGQRVVAELDRAGWNGQVAISMDCTHLDGVAPDGETAFQDVAKRVTDKGQPLAVFYDPSQDGGAALVTSGIVARDTRIAWRSAKPSTAPWPAPQDQQATTSAEGGIAGGETPTEEPDDR